MTPALQMPYRERAAVEISPRVFRKQVLRTGEIPYKGDRLKFDEPYLRRVVESFKAGAMDQVPFVLADDDNEHPDTPTDRNPNGPERYRGEVKALELAGDGVDAIIELTEEGAEVVRKNPKLGVSARLVPDLERDGQIFPVAIEHVCGTLNPRVHGLRPWESVSVRSLTQTSDQKVIDLSASAYMPDKLTDEQIEKLNELPEDSDARKALATLLEGKAPEPKKDDLQPESTEVHIHNESKGGKVADFMRKILGKTAEGKDDSELEQVFKDLQSDASREEEKPEPVASLSDADRKRIDLAEAKAREADKRVAAAEWKTERREYEQAGVPTIFLDLAEPILKTGIKVPIDLSDSEKAEASDVIRKLLDNAKGTIDLSTVGSSKDNEEKAEAKDLASNEKWEASI